MSETNSIETPKRGGGKRGRTMPKHGLGFARGKMTPQEALAIRYGKDRRTVVELAKQHRPEAFAVIVELMRKADRDSVRKDCAELVLAYSDGRPRQQLDVNVNATRSIDSIPTAELEAMLLTGQMPQALEYKGQVIEAEFAEVDGAAGPAPVAPSRRNAEKDRAARA